MNNSVSAFVETKKRGRTVGTLALCMWIVILYVGTWTEQAQEMADALAFHTEPAVYLSQFQLYFFDTLGMFFDSIVIGVTVAIFACRHRSRSLMRCVLVGVLLRYAPTCVVILLSLYHESLSSIIHSIASAAPPGFHVLLLAQFTGTVIASLLAGIFTRQHDCLNEGTDPSGGVLGTPRRAWALVVLAFLPVTHVATRMTLAIMYGISQDISSREYWRTTFSWSNLFAEEASSTNLVGLCFRIAVVLFTWATVVGLFLYGMSAIRDKKSTHRRSRVFAIFVVLPLSLVAIAMLRRTTWFF